MYVDINKGQHKVKVLISSNQQRKQEHVVQEKRFCSSQSGVMSSSSFSLTWSGVCLTLAGLDSAWSAGSGVACFGDSAAGVAGFSPAEVEFLELNVSN